MGCRRHKQYHHILGQNCKSSIASNPVQTSGILPPGLQETEPEPRGQERVWLGNWWATIWSHLVSSFEYVHCFGWRWWEYTSGQPQTKTVMCMLWYSVQSVTNTRFYESEISLLKSHTGLMPLTYWLKTICRYSKRLLTPENGILKL